MPSLSDGVARDSLIHVHKKDELEFAKLPFTKKIKKTWHELESTKQVVEVLIEFSKANECRTKMKLSSQSTYEDYHKHPRLL